MGEAVGDGLTVGDGEGEGTGSTVSVSAAGRASAPFCALASMTTW